jgi:hypothetical protein
MRSNTLFIQASLLLIKVYQQSAVGLVFAPPDNLLQSGH